MSKSDPFVILSMGLEGDRNVEIGRSETVKNSQNPDFVQAFVVDYAFYEAQTVQVKLFDDDTVTAVDNLGEVSFRLAGLMAAPGNRFVLDIQHRGRRGAGQMIIRGEEMAHVAEQLYFNLRGTRLANKDGLFGKSDPFFVISRLTESNEWQQVHKSEVVMDNLSPVWKAATVGMQRLCNGDRSRPIKFSIWDWDRDGAHDYMGSFETTAAGLLSGINKEIQVKNEKKKGKKGELAGTCCFTAAELRKEHTLLEYVRGGLQISLAVAIDFTGSNGDPRHPESLHFVDPEGRPNQYEQAIAAIGGILQDYDSDQKYPVYGFGGRINFGAVSHCFPIVPTYNNGTASAAADAEVFGIGGILDAYRACIRSVGLSGPTLFSEILATASAAAIPSPQRQQYHVLLILTDGVINDMSDTVSHLVAASNLPLSVVIVGVGNADFSQMNALDADGGSLRSPATGALAARDIVQFVPFLRCQRSPATLARETLMEIPTQLLSYFRAKGVTPNPPRPPPLMPATAAAAVAASAAAQPPGVAGVTVGFAGMSVGEAPPPLYAP